MISLHSQRHSAKAMPARPAKTSLDIKAGVANWTVQAAKVLVNRDHGKAGCGHAEVQKSDILAPCFAHHVRIVHMEIGQDFGWGFFRGGQGQAQRSRDARS
mgnify:CR=1 FL=1